MEREVEKRFSKIHQRLKELGKTIDEHYKRGFKDGKLQGMQLAHKLDLKQELEFLEEIDNLDNRNIILLKDKVD